MNPDSQLTPHFKLSEFFVHSGSFDQISWDYLLEQPPANQNLIFSNIRHRATNLEKLRTELGRPITINSGYRCPMINKLVGGEPNSFHMRGMATDIEVAGMTPQQVQEHLKDWPGGLGSYKTFTHQDDRPSKARWHG